MEHIRKEPVIDVRNMITINLDQNSRCDCLANVDASENTIELEFLHISWSEPGIACMLPDGSSQTITDYIIDGSLNRSLYVTLPKEYWNTAGTLQVMVWDGTFSSGLIEFTCIDVADNDRMTVKIDGTGYALSVYVSEGMRIVNTVYPVGSIIENASSSFDPNIAFPGTTWERIKGKVLVGVDESDTDFSTAGKTGGEKTHKLAKTELPNITGEIVFHGAGSGGTAVQNSSGVFSNKTSVSGYSYYNRTGANSIGSVKFNAGFGGGSHNNLQPYVTVYIWKRTA